MLQWSCCSGRPLLVNLGVSATTQPECLPADACTVSAAKGTTQPNDTFGQDWTSGSCIRLPDLDADIGEDFVDDWRIPVHAHRDFGAAPAHETAADPTHPEVISDGDDEELVI